MWIIGQNATTALDCVGFDIRKNDIYNQDRTGIVKSYFILVGLGIGPHEIVLAQYDSQAMTMVLLADILKRMFKGEQNYDIKANQINLFQKQLNTNIE